MEMRFMIQAILILFKSKFLFTAKQKQDLFYHNVKLCYY